MKLELLDWSRCQKQKVNKDHWKSNLSVPTDHTKGQVCTSRFSLQKLRYFQKTRCLRLQTLCVFFSLTIEASRRICSRIELKIQTKTKRALHNLGRFDWRKNHISSLWVCFCLVFRFVEMACARRRKQATPRAVQNGQNQENGFTSEGQT